jgi:catechol 2,3-dioxygenase-like lactoylglutathione lyase family enzyme
MAMINIRHVGLVVRDLDRAKYFYTQILGMQEVHSTRERGDLISRMLDMERVDIVTLKLAPNDKKTRLELINFISPAIKNINYSSLHSFGYSHIAASNFFRNQRYGAGCSL